MANFPVKLDSMVQHASGTSLKEGLQFVAPFPGLEASKTVQLTFRGQPKMSQWNTISIRGIMRECPSPLIEYNFIPQLNFYHHQQDETCVISFMSI